MFVRAKVVKGKKYGYLVENSWKKGKVKQIVKKYLGRIISLNEEPSSKSESNNQINFSQELKYVLQDIVALEFLSKGFIQGRGKTYKKDNIVVNLSKGSIQQDHKSIVLYVNGRYLYPRLLRDLLDFFAPEAVDDTKGYKLAQAFSDAGINISQENFVNLYKKIYMFDSSKSI